MATKKRPSLPPLPDLSHLTEDERKIIESVILRQRQEEEKEQEILKKLQDEFETYQKSVKKTDSFMKEDHFVSPTVNNNSKSPTNLNKDKEGVCGVCKKTLEGDVGKCHYCSTFLCNQCRTNLQLKNKDGWVCVICRKKQDILVKTGQWYHGGMAKPIDFEVDTNKLITDEMLTSQNMTTISPDHTANQTPCQTTYNTSYQNNSYNYVQSSSISHNDIRSQTIPHITQDKKDITDDTTLNFAQPPSDAFLTQQNPLNNSSPFKQQYYAMSAQQQFPPRAPLEVQYQKHLHQHPDRLMQHQPLQLDTLSIDKSPKNNAKFSQDHKVDQNKRLYSENLKASFGNQQELMYNNQDFSNKQRQNLLRDDSMGSDKSGESSSSPFTLFLPPQKDALTKHSTHKHPTPNSGVLGSSVSSSEEDGLTNSHSVVSEGAEGWSGVPKSGSMRSLPPTLGKKEQSVLWQLCENGSKLVGHMVLKKTPEEGRPDKKTLGLKVTGGRQSGTHTGAFITRVKKGSVADVVARLQSGDEVISWNRRPLRNLTFDDVYDIIFASQQDSQVELIVERVLELDENRGFERRHDPMRGYAEHRRSATPSGRYFSSEPMASPKAVSSRASSGYGGGGAYIASNSPYTDDYRYHYGGGYMGDYRYNYPPNHGMYMADYGMRRLKPRILAPLSDSPMSFHPSPCGRIHIKTAYLDAPSWQLNVTIVAASNLPPRPHNLLRNPYCKLYLLPDRSEKTKRRTKTVAGTLNPKWCQLFIYRPVRKKHLLSLALQITVYDYDRVGSGEYVGEAIVDLATCNLHDRLQSYPLLNDPFLEDQVKEHLSPPSSIISRFSDSEFSEIDASVTPTTSTTPTSMTKATTVTTSKQRNSKYKPPLMSTILHSSNDTLLDAATTSTGMALRDNDIIEESSEDHAKLEDNIEDVQEIDEAIAPERNAVRHRSRSSSGKNENGNKPQPYRHRSHERYLQTQESQDPFLQKPRGRMFRGLSSDEYMEGRSERIDKKKEKKKINLSRDGDKNRKKIGMWEGEDGLLSDQSEMSIASHLSENVLSASKKSSRREGRDSLSTTFEIGSLSDTGMPDPPPFLNPTQRGIGTRNKLPPSIGHKMAALVGLSKKKSHSATQIGEVSKRGKASFQRSEEVGGMPPQWQSSKDSGDSCFTALEAASASPAPNDGGELSSFIEGLGPGQLVGRQALGSACLGQIQLGLNGKKGFLEVEVIRARGLVPKTTTRLLPAPYIKVYLMDGKVCVEKLKTAIARRTLDPLYQKTLTFREPYEGRLLQVTIWGDYGRLERKIFMGVVQIKLDDVPLNDLVIGWYKLFAHSSIFSTASNSGSGGSGPIAGANKQLMVKQTSVSSQESAYASGSGGRS